MLTGILVPTSGSVRTCGLDPVRRRRDLARQIGVVFGQRSQLWWDLPLRESFSILAAIHRLTPAQPRPAPPSWSTSWRWRRSWTPRSASCRSASGCGPRSPPRCCTPPAAHPGRADHRPGRPEQAAAARVPAPRAREPRHHAAAHHPRHGRHRAALRPGPGRRPRHARVRRDAARAGRHGRRAPGPGGRPGRARRRTSPASPAPSTSPARAAGCASDWLSTPGPRRRRRCSPRSPPAPRCATCRSRSPTSRTSSPGSTCPGAEPSPPPRRSRPGSEGAQHPGVAQGVGLDPFEVQELRDALVVRAQQLGVDLRRTA